MSLWNRSSSALFKRAEQLKRWEESDTNLELSTPRNKAKRIQFSLECVFLAACVSGDKDEVLRLLNVGADIDTSNVDGLSALHQACIDDNLDMVEFLVKHGADINKGDNEGWTPLHATASCGFISIAKYLIEQGADIAAVNNDGELAVDIAESDEMEDLLNAVLKEKGIDPDEARNKEERLMLLHARDWLNSGKFEDIPHEKTGATALHVAASKGYIKVMDTLIQAGADVNAEDFDGWTPLHAAAHWGQKEACEILVENFCDMDKKNYVGQTAFDVSDGEMVRLLEELRKKQSTLQKERADITIININETPLKERLSVNDKDVTTYNQFIIEDVIASMDKVPIVGLTVETEKEARSKIMEENDKNVRLSNVEKQIPTLPDTTAKVPNNSVPASQPPKNVHENEDIRVPSWRKPISLRNAIRTPFRFEDEKQWMNSVSGDRNEEKTPEIALRRTQSFEADDKFYRRYCELKAKIESGNSHPVLIPPANNTNSLPVRSASLKEKQRKGLMHEDVKVPATLTQSPQPATSITNTTPSTTVQDTTSVVNAISNHNAIRRSFVPPVRDEESETQRKAHAKRVRETRRSTQGVTLEEIKSAEQLVKKKQQQQQQQLQQVSNHLNSSTLTTEPTFMLEDVRQNEKDSESSIENTSPSWSSAQPTATELTDTASVTLPLRKNNKLLEDSEPVKTEKDSKTSPTAQPINPRRKRTKRRSTGNVTFDPDEESDRLNCDNEVNDIADNDSGPGEKSGPPSRLSSTTSLGDADFSNRSPVSSSPSENGELDYKKLYEETLSENERLREKLKRTEDELGDYKSRVTDASKSSVSKNSLSELEKRERRAMERKLSEMEEELKQLQKLKAENERLRAENRALTRVVSKLTTSANAVK